MHPNHTTNDIPYGYCHCGCGEKTKIAKNTDRARGYVKGQPRPFLPGHVARIRAKRPAESRLLEKVNSTDPNKCWEWQAAHTKRGYGCFAYQGRQDMAHRVSYKLFVGAIPANHDVCHKCDNPACINPGHLFVGTRSDNMQDMAQKGRHSSPRKLSPAKERKVRHLYASGNFSQSQLGQMFGMSQTGIGKLIRRSPK